MMAEAETIAAARRALTLLDLTDLSDKASEAGVLQLCEKARGTNARAHMLHPPQPPPPPAIAVPPVAAVCIWPQYVKIARRALAGTGVKVATVANFPAGGTHVGRITGDIAEALDDGADEIDLVLPWKAFLAGDEQIARDMLAEARATCEGVTLKVILETGQYPDQERVAAAAWLAIAEGADFLKTSTGKTPVSATPEAAATLLAAIGQAARPVGLKVSGGIRSLADAEGYMEMAARSMGPDWLTPAHFRIGASSLHAALVEALGGAGARDRSDGAY